MNQRKLKLGMEHLRASDRRLGTLIDRVGPCQLKVDSNHFWMLARAILAQQISSAAARTITQRVRDHMKEELTASSLSGLPDEALRSAGVSKQKIGYLRSLTEKVIQGDIALDQLSKLSNQEVTAQLIQIKGIGVWTADMFMIFSLGRMDVFPIGDGGVRAAMRKLYRIAEDAPLEKYHKVAGKWQPYASIASWYCWRLLEEK
jgi:DNA-3-methyladenine glycosylase II